MNRLRTFGVGAAIAALAAVPLGFSGIAGAQDAGDCGEGGTAVSNDQVNVGGLLGAVAPISVQLVLPVNLPVASPNAQSCNSNVTEIGTGGGGSGGGSGSGGGHTGSGGTGGAATPTGGVAPVGGAVPALAVGGAPRFAG